MRCATISNENVYQKCMKNTLYCFVHSRKDWIFRINIISWNEWQDDKRKWEWAELMKLIWRRFRERIVLCFRIFNFRFLSFVRRMVRANGYFFSITSVVCYMLPHTCNEISKKWIIRSWIWFFLMSFELKINLIIYLSFNWVLSFSICKNNGFPVPCYTLTHPDTQVFYIGCIW